MSPISLPEGSHLAVPIEGINLIPIHQETRSLIIPKNLTKEKRDELKAYLSEAFPEVRTEEVTQEGQQG